MKILKKHSWDWIVLCSLLVLVTWVPGLGAQCIDNDLDGYGNPGDINCKNGDQTDCDDNDSRVYPGAAEICDGKDSNCDGYQTSTDVDADGDGVAWCAGDCDDNDPARYPGTVEICNGIDDDCNGIVPYDERDSDHDGVKLCDSPSDCNDFDASVYPGNDELCNDNKDNNCDGNVDESDCICNDTDADEFTSSICGGSDCDDSDSDVNPGALEICNDNKDNNCDGLSDCADSACATDAACLACTETDIDGDGYSTTGGVCGSIDCDDNDSSVHPGAAEICDGKDSNCDGSQTSTDVDADGDGVAWCAGDCDDNDPTRYPGATEICNGVDDDCNGIVPYDERDLDADGIKLCDTPSDCNDFDASIYPGNDELCGDNKDNNCDGNVDEGICSCNDADADGFTSSICGGSDCDDSDSDVNPDALEICNDNKDNNCDGLSDCADSTCVTNAACLVCIETDIDGDGYSTAGGACGPIDCDDNDSSVYPGAAEICDGKDSNCDGSQASTDVDADGDGVAWCAGDCDDNDPAKYPGAREICDDGTDNDCDGRVDEEDIADCGPPTCGTKTTPKDPPHLADLLNPDGTVHPDNAVLRCGKCHYKDADGNTVPDGNFQCQRCHADPTDTSNPLNGELKALYPEPFPYGFGSAPNVAVHSSLTVGIKYGNWDMNCMTCHNPHQQEQNRKYGTSYGKLIKEYICFNNQATGGRNESYVEFTAAKGPGSFTDGPPYNENICETCHTRTNHHQNDGTAPGGQSHNDGKNCMECHLHSAGFSPAGVIPPPPHNTDFYMANCNFCHLSDETGITQYSKPIPSEECMKCHGTRNPHSSAESESGKYSYSTECVDCHDPMFEVDNRKKIKGSISQSIIQESAVIFTSKTDNGSFADGPPYNENICETCHSQTDHHQFDGTAPLDYDESGNYIGHYDGEDCTTCHNHDNSFLPID